MSPVALFTTLPGVCENVSQTDGARPSSLTAPSTWYEAVAVPHRKPVGNVRAVLPCGAAPVDGCDGTGEPSAGAAVAPSAAAPAILAKSRRVTGLDMSAQSPSGALSPHPRIPRAAAHRLVFVSAGASPSPPAS